MKKNIKYILIGIITILSFSTLFIFNFYIIPLFQSTVSQNGTTTREKKYEVYNITVSIDYSGAQANEIFPNINLTNYETTAFHAVANCCIISYIDFSWGLQVQEINGVTGGWIYWVNNDPLPNIPSNFFNLLDNDTVNWKYVS